MSARIRKTFRHPVTGHTTRTSLPVEQTRLRGQGYVEVVAAPKPAAPKQADNK